jgi:hypothetical protein
MGFGSPNGTDIDLKVHRLADSLGQTLIAQIQKYTDGIGWSLTDKKCRQGDLLHTLSCQPSVEFGARGYQ